MISLTSFQQRSLSDARSGSWQLFFSSLALVSEDAEKKEAPTALRAVNVNVAVWLGPICAI